MTRKRLRLILALACASALGAWARAQDAGAAPHAPVRVGGGEAEKSSTLRGRVVFDDTNEPARRANVVLVRLDEPQDEGERMSHGGTPGAAATDERGEFAISRLAAGKYLVTITAAAGVAPDGVAGRHAAARAEHDDPERVAERTVELDRAGAVERTFRVRRGAAVSGRVTYADGEAATNAQVGLFCRDADGWSRCGAGGVRTDDRGRYRVEGLPPGEYVVGAAELNVAGEEARDYSTDLSFSGAYHPAARTPAAAEPVRVEAGREVEGVDVVLGDDARVVSGTVSWTDGRPAARATVRLQAVAAKPPPAYTQQFGRSGQFAALLLDNALDASVENRATPTDEAGRFTFDGVPEGEYLLTAAAQISEGEREDAVIAAAVGMAPGFAQKSQRVTVGAAGAEGLAVRLSTSGRISGRVVFEGGPPAGVYLLARPAAGAGLRPYVQVAAPDGTFSIEGLNEGEFFLDGYPMDGPGDGYYVRSVTGPDGADLLRTPARVAEGAVLDGVRVVLAADGATLVGRVHARGGRTPYGVGVFLVPADAGLWGVRARQFFVGAERDGSFLLRCPPGDYLLIAAEVGRGAASYASAAELVRAHGGGAVRVMLGPKERREVEVPVAGGK